MLPKWKRTNDYIGSGSHSKCERTTLNAKYLFATLSFHWWWNRVVSVVNDALCRCRCHPQHRQHRHPVKNLSMLQADYSSENANAECKAECWYLNADKSKRRLCHKIRTFFSRNFFYEIKNYEQLLPFVNDAIWLCVSTAFKIFQRLYL